MLPPRPPARMRVSACWVTSSTCVKLVRIRASQPRGRVSMNGAKKVPPTTFTSTSRRSKLSSNAAKNPATASGSRTSSVRLITRRPVADSSSAVRVSASSSRSHSAMPRPRPPPPPVTTATLPAKFSRSSRKPTTRSASAPTCEDRRRHDAGKNCAMSIGFFSVTTFFPSNSIR